MQGDVDSDCGGREKELAIEAGERRGTMKKGKRKDKKEPLNEFTIL